jgi:hypothetical protein
LKFGASLELGAWNLELLSAGARAATFTKFIDPAPSLRITPKEMAEIKIR